mmetsp:Transcript_25372/g.90681  ORF Transcript_25372/g.90681 Transcript_25372/m.90681 type:complete len:299 (+) Transcript_25372:85-981(+)
MPARLSATRRRRPPTRRRPLPPRPVRRSSASALAEGAPWTRTAASGPSLPQSPSRRRHGRPSGFDSRARRPRRGPMMHRRGPTATKATANTTTASATTTTATARQPCTGTTQTAPTQRRPSCSGSSRTSSASSGSTVHRPKRGASRAPTSSASWRAARLLRRRGRCTAQRQTVRPNTLTCSRASPKKAPMRATPALWTCWTARGLRRSWSPPRPCHAGLHLERCRLALTSSPRSCVSARTRACSTETAETRSRTLMKRKSTGPLKSTSRGITPTLILKSSSALPWRLDSLKLPKEDAL